MGVLMSYGFVARFATPSRTASTPRPNICNASAPGSWRICRLSPAVSVEFARKALLSDVRPTFYEVEEAVQALPAV